MAIEEILALAGRLAELANKIMDAHKANNQADLNTAWVAMQGELKSANDAWEAAGKPAQINPQP